MLMPDEAVRARSLAAYEIGEGKPGGFPLLVSCLARMEARAVRHFQGGAHIISTLR